MLNRKDTFLYVATCSDRSRGNFLLSRLDTHQKLKKEIMLRLEAEVDRLAENLFDVILANLFRDHGEEIISRLPSPHRLPELPKPQRVISVPSKLQKKA